LERKLRRAMDRAGAGDDASRRKRQFMCLVVEDCQSGAIVGTATLSLSVPDALFPAPLPTTKPVRHLPGGSVRVRSGGWWSGLGSPHSIARKPTRWTLRQPTSRAESGRVENRACTGKQQLPWPLRSCLCSGKPRASSSRLAPPRFGHIANTPASFQPGKRFSGCVRNWAQRCSNGSSAAVTQL